MNYRWWLLQTLEKNRVDFAITNILLVSSFAARIGILAYILVFILLPRMVEFIEVRKFLRKRDSHTVFAPFPCDASTVFPATPPPFRRPKWS